MDNTQKKKKKINMSLVLIMLLLLSAMFYAGYEFFYKPYKTKLDGEAGNEVLQNVEDGTVYVYSEEEKEEFRKIAAEYREFKVKQKNLKPGDAIFLPSFDIVYAADTDIGVNTPDEYFDSYQKSRMLYLSRMKNCFENSREREDASEKYYDADVVSAGNLFDENLKLKNPEIFCGFGSVAKPIFDTGMYSGQNINFSFEGDGIDSNLMFQRYVKTLKNIDRDYKNNNNLASIINKEVIGKSSKYFNFEINLDEIGERVVGSVLLQGNMFNKENKLNSINPFQKIIKYRPKTMTRPGDGIPGIFNSTMEATDVDLFPQDYNYFVDKENYFVDFVPSKITKYDEKTYLVDIEVDKPLDQTAIGVILNTFYNRFYYVDRHGAESEYNLDLSIRITHNDLSSEMLNEYGIYTITPIYAYSDKLPDIGNEFFLNWYPNEEAQVWVKEYFELAKEAFDNDSRFSMFETMHQLADKYGVSHKTMESVICSYYYTMTAIS